jgi:isopropylmalate/homocitrate/citramalate synthase
VIARPVAGDIEAALESGAESIALFVGTSDSHLSEKLRTSRDDVIAQIGAAVAEVKREGRQAVFAAEDATRTPLEFLLEALEAAAASGADAVAIADTVGIATPRQMADLVRAAAAAVDVPIAVHCHDDLGLATANSIAGLLAGASAVQCSVLGIGERAGNAALEEVALALEVAYGVRTGLRLAELNSVAAYVAGIVGQPVSPNKAVVGANAFVHESGLHLDGVVREPRTYEPFAPEVVGASRRFVFGKHSGRRAIAHVLEHHRIAADDALVESLVADVKRSGEAKDAIDETELVARAGALGRRNRTVHLAKGEAQ